MPSRQPLDLHRFPIVPMSLIASILLYFPAQADDPKAAPEKKVDCAELRQRAEAGKALNEAELSDYATCIGSKSDNTFGLDRGVSVGIPPKSKYDCLQDWLKGTPPSPECFGGNT